MKKEFLKFGIIFFVTLAVVLWSLNFIFFNKNAPKSKATADYINFTFNPPSVTPDAGADFTVSVLATPSINTVLRGYKTKINFDKAILQLKSIQYKVGVVSAGLGNTDADLATINSKGYVIVVAEDTSSTGYTLTSANGAEIVTLTFKAVTKTPSNVIIDNSEFYSVDSNAILSNNWVYSSVILGVNGGVGPSVIPVCESFSDDFSGTTLNTDDWGTWTDNNGTQTVNGELTLDLPISTDGKTKGVSIDTYDKHNLENTDYTVETILKSVSASDNKVYLDSKLAVAAINNDNRGIWISRYSDSGRISAVFQNVANDTTGEVEDKELGLTNDTPIKVKIEKKGSVVKTYYDLLDGQGYILLKEFNNYYTAKDRIALILASGGPDFPQGMAKFDDFKLTCPAVPTSIVTVNPTGGLGNNEVKLDVKLKFQGIGSKPPTDALSSMLVKFTLYDETTGQNADYDIAKVISDEKGIWSGISDLTVNTSHKFALLVKGPYHVQKKVCDLVPTETAGGTYRCSDGKITLNPGANDLDLSGILLLVGDLPEQNGTVDAYDISLVRNCLGKTDETCLNNADVNRDGKVDTQDYSLIIASLSVKSDEE